MGIGDLKEWFGELVHVHFMISAPGFEQLVTHVFVAGDKYLDSDVVFGVKDSLIRLWDSGHSCEASGSGSRADQRVVRQCVCRSSG